MFMRKIVLVTGAGQGIGEVVAKDFALNGDHVILIDINKEKVNKVNEEINNNIGSSECYLADVSDYERAEEIIDQIVEKHGKIDVLVNNAGITKDVSLKKMTKEDWNKVIDINLTGVFNYTRHVFAKMLENRSGRIINLSSVVGVKGNFGQINYSASKAGVIGLTKTAAIEGAKKGITVNAVAPGFIETEMTERMSEKAIALIQEQIPMNEFGTIKDISEMILFLASDKASYITGQVININGGLYM